MPHPGFPDADPERELLVSQRNDVLRRIERAGFDPREFTWERMRDNWTTHDDAYVPAIVHRPTGFFCAISNRPFFVDARMGMQGLFQVQASPGVHHRVEHVTGIGSFLSVLAQVDAWLARIRREDVPDRWQELEASRALVGRVIEHEPDNTPFGPDDRARIAATLDELRAVAVRMELTAAQLSRVDVVIAYLQPAADRFGRKDWFLLAVALFTWAVPVTSFAQAVVSALQWVVHLPPLLPR